MVRDLRTVEEYDDKTRNIRQPSAARAVQRSPSQKSEESMTLIQSSKFKVKNFTSCILNFKFDDRREERG